MRNDFHRKGNRKGLLLGACAILLTPSLAPAQQTRPPDCAARLTLKQEGVGHLTGVEKAAAARGLVPLDNDKTASLVLTLANRGKAEKFDVTIEPVGGVQVTAGGGARKLTVKSGESGAMPLTVKGTDVGESCDWRSRGLRITARPQGVSAGKACATFETRFFCPSQNKRTAGP